MSKQKAKLLLPLKSEKGMGLLSVLMFAALLAVITSAISTQLSQMSKTAAQARDQADLENFIEMLAGVINDPVGCYGTNNNVPRSLPTDPSQPTDLNGLRFYGNSPPAAPAATATQRKFNPGLTSQWVSLGSNLVTVPGGPRLIVQNKISFPNQNIKVDGLYLGVASPVSAGVYKATLMLSASSLRTGLPFAPHAVADVTIGAALFSAPNYKMLSCQGGHVASATCAQMGCIFHTSGTPSGMSSCTCGYPDLVCPTDTNGDQMYLTGYDQAAMKPICQSIRFQCATGLFFAGFNTSGKPICFAVEM